MRQIKIRAASRGRKLKDEIAELLEKGMASPQAQTSAAGEQPFCRHSKTGFLVSRTLNTPGYLPPTPGESQAIIERANEEEDLHRAGLFP